MNPLYQKFYKYIRDQALNEFQRSGTGSILKEIDRLSRSRTGDTRALQQLTKSLIGAARSGGFTRQLRQSELGKAFGQVERYAAGGAKAALLESMFRSLGPLGEVFRAFLRPKRTPMTGIAREIEAARNLLRVFRPDLLKESQTPIASRLPANKPPTRPLGGTGPGAPLTSSRFKMPEDVKEAQELLESMGFTVTPPNKKPKPANVEYITTQAGDRVALRTSGKVLPYRTDDPILTGVMVKVESSNVHSIGFIFDHDNPNDSVLKVRFWQSSRKDKSQRVAGPMYFYYRVPPEVFQRFRAAASMGKFVWDKLRIRGTVTGHQYQYELKGIAEEYVPRKATRLGPNEYFLKRRISVRSPQGDPMGMRESERPDRFVQPYDPTRGNRPQRATGKRRGPKGPGG